MNRSHSLLYLISFGLTLLKQVHVCIRLPANLCSYCIHITQLAHQRRSFRGWVTNAQLSPTTSMLSVIFTLSTFRIHLIGFGFCCPHFCRSQTRKQSWVEKQQSELYLNPASQRPNQIVFTATVGLSSSTEFLGFFYKVLYTHTDHTRGLYISMHPYSTHCAYSLLKISNRVISYK